MRPFWVVLLLLPVSVAAQAEEVSQRCISQPEKGTPIAAGLWHDIAIKIDLDKQQFMLADYGDLESHGGSAQVIVFQNTEVETITYSLSISASGGGLYGAGLAGSLTFSFESKGDRFRLSFQGPMSIDLIYSCSALVW